MDFYDVDKLWGGLGYRQKEKAERAHLHETAAAESLNNFEKKNIIGGRTGMRRRWRMQINREDMLELTRRMNISRNCFGRIAGAYMDGEGYVDGSFNTHFQKLSGADKTKHLQLAKTVLLSGTNTELRDYRFLPGDRAPGSIWQLLMALRGCELKNDALLLSLYEYMGERYRPGYPYGIYVFHGNYDVPLKGSDKVAQRESEEVYNFLVCALCPVSGAYEPGSPEWGFLFPAFSARSTDVDGIHIFSTGERHKEREKILF